MKIDFEKIERETGRRFESPEDVEAYTERALVYLATHNKNYTRRQFEIITELLEIFQAVKREEA